MHYGSIRRHLLRHVLNVDSLNALVGGVLKHGRHSRLAH
jgi:hypothetical protein